MFPLKRKPCFLMGDFSFKESSLTAVKWWHSDFDVRLVGLNTGTEGHCSFTDLVPPFLPFSAQTDPVCLSVKSQSKKSHLAVRHSAPLPPPVLRHQPLNPPFQQEG